MRAGADAFITKPLFKSKMLHVLQLFVTVDTETQNPTEALENDILAGKRILVVEDNELNREIAVELLQMHNMDVVAVENGQLAVDKFKASVPGEYDIILMDIQMPVLNGYEAASCIRSMNRSDADSIPILAMTADAFAEDVMKARKAGMNDHIAKPIDIKYLVEVLERWLE